eukprot:symbB.v1.2.007703.t1/scaffold477.1/size198972/2
MASQTTESKTCEVDGVDPFQMILQYMERHFTNQGDLLEQINQQLHEALMGRLGERVLVEPTGSGHADGGGSASLPASFLGSEASAEAPKTALPASRDMAMPKTATLKTPKMMGISAPLRSGSNLSVTLPLPERSSERSRLRNSRNSVGSKESKDSLGLDSNLSAEHHHQHQSEEHLGTSSKATFVTQEIQRQERMARKAARKLTEQKLSSISAAVYWSQRPKDENWAHRIINSWWFVHFISTVIVVNMILLGIEVDLAAAIGQENVSPWYGIINATAVGIFVVELSLTFIALGIRRFFCGKDRAWNVFDFCIIGLSVLETSTELWQQALAASSSSSEQAAGCFLSMSMWSLTNIHAFQPEVIILDDDLPFFHHHDKLDMMDESEELPFQWKRSDIINLTRTMSLKQRGERKKTDELKLLAFLQENQFSCINQPKLERMQCSGLFATRLHYPLHVAARFGDFDVVRLLLKAQADMEARDSRGLTALKVAEASDRNGSHEDIITLLQCPDLRFGHVRDLFSG